jgi:hypothetical protein
MRQDFERAAALASAVAVCRKCASHDSANVRRVDRRRHQRLLYYVTAPDFAAAAANTSAGGEVIVLDSAGYGPSRLPVDILAYRASWCHGRSHRVRG